MLAERGRIVVIGCRGTIEINPRETMAREADIRGMILMKATPEEKQSIHAALGAGLSNGTLKPVVGKELSLSEAPEAHVAVMEPGGLWKDRVAAVRESPSVFATAERGSPESARFCSASLSLSLSMSAWKKELRMISSNWVR